MAKPSRKLPNIQYRLMKILVTGSAGFIGMHLTLRLCKEGHEVVGIDNLNDYYPVQLKHDRLAHSRHPHYRFLTADLTDKASLDSLFALEGFQIVIHLAAQAGVRYSLTHPDAYIQSNIVGFLNILECCRSYPVQHLLYASSSSVYGNAKQTPFTETQNTDETVSLYAATKKSNELMAHTYSHLFGIPSTGMRFFTVYGPWGRPDMAYYSFAHAIVEGKPIQLFNAGDMYRDFTYVDDIVEAILRLITLAPVAATPKRILNLGHSSPVYIKDFLAILEEKLGRKALIENRPMQDTDVYTTYADTAALEQLTGYHPQTNIADGLERFCDWYLGYAKRAEQKTNYNQALGK